MIGLSLFQQTLIQPFWNIAGVWEGLRLEADAGERLIVQDAFSWSSVDVAAVVVGAYVQLHGRLWTDHIYVVEFGLVKAVHTIPLHIGLEHERMVVEARLATVRKLHKSLLDLHRHRCILQLDQTSGRHLIVVLLQVGLRLLAVDLVV